jgi:hypothetical protein
VTVDSALEQLANRTDWLPDWDDVRRRSGLRHRPEMVKKRRAITFAIVATVIVVLVPLTAFATSSDWWFLRAGAAPTPAQAPSVVLSGSWEGKPWELATYPAQTGSLCWSITPKGHEDGGYGAAQACGRFSGVSPHGVSGAMRISFVASGESDVLPAHVAGPVVAAATEVEIHFDDGRTITTPTVAAPPPLADVRFFATDVPSAEFPSTRDAGPPVQRLVWLAGIDASGHVVACLEPRNAVDGLSPLAACQ